MIIIIIIIIIKVPGGEDDTGGGGQTYPRPRQHAQAHEQGLEAGHHWAEGDTGYSINTSDIVLPEGDTGKCKEGAHGRHIATVEPLSAGVNILPEFQKKFFCFDPIIAGK